MVTARLLRRTDFLTFSKMRLFVGLRAWIATGDVLRKPRLRRRRDTVWIPPRVRPAWYREAG
ncbi:hypothetical protein A989_11299 [Xanthomonas translucens DAR61454]|nr:hypothetical protein A989_11299 [Xanthomonas translucens DAR61454]